MFSLLHSNSFFQGKERAFYMEVSFVRVVETETKLLEIPFL
jgi:hypothetical protein